MDTINRLSRLALKWAGIGFAGFLALVIEAMIFNLIFGPQGENRKAVASTARAATIAGDFGPDDERVYAAGVDHVLRLHENLGGLTIWQVLNGERVREAAQADARTAAAEQLQARNEQRATDHAAAVAAASDRAKARAATLVAAHVLAGEHADIKADFEFLVAQGFHENFPVRSYRVDGATLWIEVDDDVFGAMSGQDQTMLRTTFEKSWAQIYNQRNGTTDETTNVEIQDLNGKVI